MSICIFNATPLEKYESYRLFLDQWSRCDGAPDFAPTIYNLIDSLVSFLGINRYSPHNSTQPKFLVDMLPEVYAGSSEATLRRLLSRKGIPEQDLMSMRERLEKRGSMYLPAVNAFCVRDFQMMHAAEDVDTISSSGVSRIACSARSDRIRRSPWNHAPSDHFYIRVMEHAVAFFGSRVLYPSRPTPEAPGAQLSRAACEKAAQIAAEVNACEFETSAQEWGYRIGAQIYEGYLAGKITPANVRRLFLAHLHEPGLARKVCATVISKLRSISRAAAKAAHA